MQGKLFVILSTIVFGRMTMICVILIANRKFFNYYISTSIFILSTLISILSYFLKQETLDNMGMVFTGKTLYL